MADKWIVKELDILINSVTTRLNNSDFSLAAEELTEFTWNKLADWYLEIAKVENKDEILVYILKNLLTLWHPFIPFVSETIWQSFNKDLLMVSVWPKALNIGDSAQEFEIIQKIIVEIRKCAQPK